MPAKSATEDFMFCLKKKTEKDGSGEKKGFCREIWTKRIAVQFPFSKAETTSPLQNYYDFFTLPFFTPSDEYY